MLALSSLGLHAAVQLPGSSRTPYVLPAPENNLWTSTAVITSGDTAANGYRFVGIPDGMGAFDNGDGTFTVLINHELSQTVGVVRAHGAKGAFVSKLTLRKSDLAVVAGEDLIKSVKAWDTTLGTWVTLPAGDPRLTFGRFCSADLALPTAYFNRATGKGTTERIFMNGEEIGDEGRGIASVVTGPDAGIAFELPALGKFSWENSVACPFEQDKTIVIGTDDTTPGQVYVYVGNKATTGNTVERAGLRGGRLYGVKVENLPTEPTIGQFTKAQRLASFSLAEVGDVTLKTGAEIQTLSTGALITAFNRPEDGSWNPLSPNEFYFVTTASITGSCRLWVLKFKDITQPESGGIIELLWDGLYDGDKSYRMFDNITVTRNGQVLIQEDPGNNAYLARIHTYDIAKKTMRTVVAHAEDFFKIGATAFITQDEESSGIIDVSDILGAPDLYLGVDQVHAAPTANATEVVEQGQLFLLSPSSRAVNISSRGRVQGNDPMIAGFVISGTEPKTVMIRALGPTLSAFGVDGVLANPRLQIFQGAQPVAENNDWRFNQNAPAIAATGMAPTQNAESAMLITLDPGAYTAMVRDEGGGSGIALVDVYEFDLRPAHTAARVVNLSTRATVLTGENVLIGGFVTEGREPKKLLIRALGASLANYGVTTALADATVELVDSQQTTILTNDDWNSNAAAAAYFTANPLLRPLNATDAAAVVTLAPGTYTAVIRGKNGATGTALVEVNEAN